MKKLIIAMSTVAAALATHAQDTLVLRSGTVVGGKFIKMDDGVIVIKTSAETKEYKAGEIKMMKFCSPVKGSGPSHSEGRSYSNSSSSSGGTPCDVKEDTEKGTVLFECNMCGTKGSLKIYGREKNENNTSVVRFSADEAGYRFNHKERLIEGEYKWEYQDNRNNAANGVLKIKKGETKKIILFEKE
jgi:hypothetical protein